MYIVHVNVLELSLTLRVDDPDYPQLFLSHGHGGLEVSERSVWITVVVVEEVWPVAVQNGTER